MNCCIECARPAHAHVLPKQAPPRRACCLRALEGYACCHVCLHAPEDRGGSLMVPLTALQTLIMLRTLCMSARAPPDKKPCYGMAMCEACACPVCADVRVQAACKCPRSCPASVKVKPGAAC